MKTFSIATIIAASLSSQAFASNLNFTQADSLGRTNDTVILSTGQAAKAASHEILNALNQLARPNDQYVLVQNNQAQNKVNNQLYPQGISENE